MHDPSVNTRILFLTGNEPLFGKGGQDLRTKAALQMLSSIGPLTVLTPFYTARVDRNLMGYSASVEDGVTLEYLPAARPLQATVRNDVFSRAKTRLRRLLFWNEWENLFHVSTAAKARIEKTVRNGHYRIAWIDEDGFMGQYIESLKKLGLHVVYNTQNIQSRLNDQVRRLNAKPKAGLVSSIARRIPFRLESMHERVFFSRADRLCYCNQNEASYYSRFIPKERLFYLPNVAAVPQNGRHRAAASPYPYIVWTGTLAAPFHLEGLRIFLREVWPSLSEKFPDLHFVVAGWSRERKLDGHESLGQVPARVRVFTNPPDVTAYLRGALLAVVPLFRASGTRIKILDAIASGIPVVSTSKGAEGLELENGREIILADSQEAFVQAIRRLLQEAELRRQIAEAAFKVLNAKYTLEANAPAVHRLIEGLLRKEAA